MRSAAKSSRSAHAMETALDPIIAALEEVVYSHVCIASFVTVHEYSLSPGMPSSMALLTHVWAQCASGVSLCAVT